MQRGPEKSRATSLMKLNRCQGGFFLAVAPRHPLGRVLTSLTPKAQSILLCSRVRIRRARQRKMAALQNLPTLYQ
jgi:hypothetical protein